MRGRAQTSVEFIVILAAILGILVLVLSITDSFPDIGHNFKDRHYQTFWEIQDIGILNSYFNATNSSLLVSNNLDDVITLLQISLDSLETNVSYQLDPGEILLVNLSFNFPEGKHPLELLYTNEANGVNYSVYGNYFVQLNE